MKKHIFILISIFFSLPLLAQTENEPFMEEIYFTNKKGERITGSVTVDEKFVFLNIKSTNAIGEKVKLTMDEDEEYLYKNKFLAGGSSVKFLVKKDLQKVKLTIYNPNKKKHVKLRKEANAEKEAQDAES